MSRVRTCPKRFVPDRSAEAQESETEGPITSAPVNTGGCLEKLTIADYLAAQRQKVYTRYSHSVKRDINGKLQKDIELELQKICYAETHVEEDELFFQEIIKEKEQKLSDALELDIESYKEKLTEYTQYKDFFTGLAPATWREEQKMKREQRRAPKPKEEEAQKTKQADSAKGRVKKSGCEQKKPAPEAPKPEKSDSDEEPEIYFTDPMEVMTALDELMEEDLFHIQDFQDTEEDMTRIHKVLHQTETDTQTTMQNLHEQIEKLKTEIQAAEDMASDLELKSRLFSYGEYNVNQDKMIRCLHDKVKNVYAKCVDGVESSTLSMLTSIEDKVEDIIERIEELPPGVADAIERARETERRQKMQEMKQLMEKQAQQERMRRATERALADIKKLVCT
ncbi:coiled-coil domain-containing protein 38-like [Megalops cyprinoides]|uniref:coiled-coil domain-containing protein 38-like n=1 Tax=Megalops cyprinoides TaxID=118141 RepID=UPI001864D9CE|nr:coiled-coil domain-containing protein 38-like [Megalops cyprinoides]